MTRQSYQQGYVSDAIRTRRGIVYKIRSEAERTAALALEQAIYGDLFPVVPEIGNRNNKAAVN